MAEALLLPRNGSKSDTYAALIPQIESLLAHESDLTANLANIAAVLKEAFDPLWVGFYLTQGDHLVLGPFQGPLACTRISVKPVPKGVCGAAYGRRETVLVPDVEKFPGHIACSSLSRSEIVVPLVHNGETALVLDVDSRDLNAYDEEDAAGLEAIVQLIAARHYR
jgi:L-methionine (R)-S-oxide reductase